MKNWSFRLLGVVLLSTLGACYVGPESGAWTYDAPVYSNACYYGSYGGRVYDYRSCRPYYGYGPAGRCTTYAHGRGLGSGVRPPSGHGGYHGGGGSGGSPHGHR